MSAYKYNCPEGWLLAPSSTDESMVPFFVHTMGSCIHYSLTDTFNESILKLLEGITNCTVDFSRSIIKFIKNNWGIELNSDGSYKATREFKLSSEGYFTDERDIMNIHVDLPFTTIKDPFVRFSNYIKTDNRLLKETIVTIDIDGEIRTDNLFTKATVQLYNPNEVFSSNRSLTDFTNTSVVVTFEGNIG